MVVLDTHVLVWWTLDPEQLSETARHHCDEVSRDGALVSSISLWEIGIKVKRGQLSLGLDMEEYARRLALVKGLQIVPVEAEHWLANLQLPWSHRDPADRTIVALAQLQDYPLITKDEAIRAFYDKAIW